MRKHKIKSSHEIFEIWWHKHSKVICLCYYEWGEPDFWIHSNGAKRKNGDRCFDFNIHFGKLAFWYTNFDLQREVK